ncbi:MAG: hypothetical protein ACI4WH_07315 [Oscillospiraceae bacterium]
MIFRHGDFEIEVIQSSYTLNSTDNPPYDCILNPFSEDEYFHEYNFYEIILNRYFSIERYIILVSDDFEEDCQILNKGLNIIFLTSNHLIISNLEEKKSYKFGNFCYYGIKCKLLDDYILLITYYGKRLLVDYNGNEMYNSNSFENISRFEFGDVIPLEEISPIEEKYNIKLPQDYLDFITTKHNGFINRDRCCVMYAIEYVSFKDYHGCKALLLYSSECYGAYLFVNGEHYGKILEFYDGIKKRHIITDYSFIEWLNIIFRKDFSI